MTNHLYDILGIDRSASDQEIKRAYRALTLKYHPDRNSTPEAAAKIREINEAYAVLGDPQKRRLEQQRSSSSSSSFRTPEEFEATSPMDLFHMLFGQQGVSGFPTPPEMAFFHMAHPAAAASFATPPPPIQQSLVVTLEQAYLGCTLPIEIDRWVLQEGNLKVRELETVYVDIPPGMDDSEMIVLVDKGNVLHDRSKGVVKVKVSIENTTAFRRQGMDLIYPITLSLKEALCGFSFEMKHLNGKTFSMNNTKKVIPPHFRKIVPGYGMVRDKNVGSLILEFDVRFPEELTPQQVESLGSVL